MRVPFIGGNWKMNLTRAQAAELAAGLRRDLNGLRQVEVAVFPAFLSIEPARAALDGSAVRLGAQDLHWEDQGAFTGEVSGPMLRDAGVGHAIVGHSERRHVIGENNETIRKKLRAARRSGLTVVLCVGELLEEKSQGFTKEVVEKQVTQALEGTSPQEREGVLIAYEPVWAIGTGKVATADYAQKIHHFIRNLVRRIADGPTADAMRVIYGGSVTPENIGELIAQEDIDGALVGGASLKADAFTRIVRTVAERKGGGA
jgi:triosephosphate isomerase